MLVHHADAMFDSHTGIVHGHFFAIDEDFTVIMRIKAIENIH